MKNWFIKQCTVTYGCYINDAEKFCDSFKNSSAYDRMLKGMKAAERLCKFSLLNVLRLFIYKLFGRRPSFMVKQ